jgi:hypothetical protein
MAQIDVMSENLILLFSGKTSKKKVKILINFVEADKKS